ncbi:DUF1549 and DUF1553 domain-containing protein [Chthonomonas calidirosea]|nr:DUF1549 and DUF1553 domain-containing protein [Chthonomonas calidirosea]
MMRQHLLITSSLCRASALGGLLFVLGGFLSPAQAAPRNLSPTSQLHVQPHLPVGYVSFVNDVEPTLTRLGCNQGACHGSQYGKGGFKLSLFGTDSDLDYIALTRQAKGRRVNVADPIHSLILLKPTMTVPHGGGRRLIPGSSYYYTLLHWIQEGAPGPNPNEPKLVSLSVTPSEKVAYKGSSPFHIIVKATYSDGSVRNVTSLANINTIDDGVASCTPDGVVRAVGSGQTPIMARFGGLATVCIVMVPYPSHAPYTPQTAGYHANPADPDQKIVDEIDALVEQKQKALHLSPSPICSDRTFIRRVFFDLIGTAPSPREIEEFVASKDPNKRAHLIDTLLNRPEYADYWALKWADLLRVNRNDLQVKGMWSFDNWLHNEIQQNVPIDQMVRTLILAEGSTYTNGPANFYRVSHDPSEMAETTSQVFLGVRLQCAKCHHHPFEKWSQEDYYRFAAFFARIGQKGSQDFGIFGNDTVVYVRDNGEVVNPATGKVAPPVPLGVHLAALEKDGKYNPDATGDRRLILANWITSPQNPWFATNWANRYWAYMMGAGLVNPIDDLRVTNPPTNPPLLNLLTHTLVQFHFDAKHYLRVLCLTRTYQRSSRATVDNAKDTLFFTHYVPRRLPAEVLSDAIDKACGTTPHFGGLPAGIRAIDLPDPNVGSDFLNIFGRPQRLTSCECERNETPNLSQALELMNGNDINNRVTSPDGRIAKLIKSGASDNAIINDLYLATLGRLPTQRERDIILGALIFSEHREHVFQDVLATLLGTKEFIFNH